MDNILGTDFSFYVHVHSGVGAYVWWRRDCTFNSLEENVACCVSARLIRR